MKRSAFTLVELLVVVAVIALLVAILIPAVNAAREHARRNQCLTQQRTLAIAMITYAKENNGLPGYLNELGNTPIHSWAVAIFPMIGEQTRYESLMSRSPPTSPAPEEARVSPPVLLCPSFDRPERNTPQLHYVVNCGPTVAEVADNSDNAIALTLYRDRRSSIPGVSSLSDPDLRTINRRVKIEDIPDGASNTILLSENMDAGLWHRDDWAIPGTTADFTNIRDRQAVLELGFVWENNAEYAPNFFPSSPSSRLPRPSSRHPGAVIAAFADGSARPINDNIDIMDWLKFVCPDDKKAGF